MVELRHVLIHGRPHWFIVIIEGAFPCGLAPDRNLSCFKLLFDHGSLREVSHGRSLRLFKLVPLQIGPVGAGLLQLLHSLFECFLFVG